MTKETILLIKVTPQASKNEIIYLEGETLKVRLSVVPEKGKANKALIQLLSKKLKISQSQITIVQGQTSRNKKVSIAMEPLELKERLNTLLKD